MNWQNERTKAKYEELGEFLPSSVPEEYRPKDDKFSQYPVLGPYEYSNKSGCLYVYKG